MIVAVHHDMTVMVYSIGFVRSADGCSFLTVATVVAVNMRVLFSLRASTAIFLDGLFGVVYYCVMVCSVWNLVGRALVIFTIFFKEYC